MKSIIRFLFCFIWMSYVTVSTALAYTPTTKWPYLYENFQEGVVFFSQGEKTSHLKLNIHLQNATLHHLDGDNIIQVNPSRITKVEIGNDTFIYMNGVLVQVIKSENDHMLVKLVKADFKALTKGGTGAYGMTTEVSATDDLSSFRLGEGSTTNLNYSQMKLEQSDGKELPLIKEYYFILGDKIIEATRKDVTKSLTEAGQAQLKAFIKQHKIKWKDESGLIKLLDFYKK